MIIRLFGWVGVLLVTVSSAQAGEVLRLKSARHPIALVDRSTELPSILGLDQDSGHFVVQFVAAISQQDHDYLRAQGIEPIRYIPDDALLVRASLNAVALAKTASSRIRAVSPFEPEWKISPEFWTEPTRAAREERLLIALHAGADASATAREIGRIRGATVDSANERDLLVRASAANLQSIAEIDAVEWIERAPVMISLELPVDPIDAAGPATMALTTLTGYESGTKLMGFDAAWSRGYSGAGQIAAVADTGLDTGSVDTLHADFKDTFAKGYLAGLGTKSWGDPQGHGTHVAGSVVGTAKLSDGAFQGGAHGAKLYMQGIWSAILDNLAPSTDMSKLLDPVYKDGARIQTNSWGSPRNLGEYDTFAARVDEYMWSHPDLLVLFAAGNSGQDMDRDGRIDEGSIGSPATAKNVLSVGASENTLATGGIQKPARELRDGDKKWGAEPVASGKLSDNGQGIAAFSSRGPTSDGRLKPEIVAPGTNIVSTRSHHPKAGALWGAYDVNYAYAGGTSMAAPLTASAATVAREFLVKARGFDSPSAALVKATLMHTATELFPGQYGTGQGQELPVRRPNVHEGYGRVDMDAVTSLGQETYLGDETLGVGLGEEKSVNVTVPAGASLRATLVYTDAPASVSASRTLVNDLDLKVVGADGKTRQKQDRINNAEMLELSGLAAGTYKVVVSGVNVPHGKGGKQPFALIVTAK